MAILFVSLRLMIYCNAPMYSYAPFTIKKLSVKCMSLCVACFVIVLLHYHILYDLYKDALIWTIDRTVIRITKFNFTVVKKWSIWDIQSINKSVHAQQKHKQPSNSSFIPVPHLKATSVFSLFLVSFVDQFVCEIHCLSLITNVTSHKRKRGREKFQLCWNWNTVTSIVLNEKKR